MKDLEGKTYLVTGANTGIGRVTATELAKRGGRLLIATRSEEKTKPVLADIASAGGKAEWIELDLGDLASVRKATDAVEQRTDKLDALVANAGIGGQRGFTRSGFELQFGTNHIGHFLFTMRLLDLLERSAPSRIVVVASAAHYRAKGIDWDAVRKPTATVSGFPEYCVSKLANVLFARELAGRVKDKGIHTYSLHPGGIASDIWRRVPWPIRPAFLMLLKTVEEGAQSSLHCAASAEAGSETGLYYHSNSKVKEPSDLAKDHALSAELWKRSEQWTTS
jgi:NAD(P)-dependent dehydrogenase (short-subunit alcohol dehydrogenase family)